MEECGARDLRSRDDFREKFNKGLEFRLEMDAVSGNDRPVGVSFPARDHEDATARDSFDVMINIDDEVDWWAHIHDVLAPILHEGIYTTGPERCDFGIKLGGFPVDPISKSVASKFDFEQFFNNSETFL